MSSRGNTGSRDYSQGYGWQVIAKRQLIGDLRKRLSVLENILDYAPIPYPGMTDKSVYTGILSAGCLSKLGQCKNLLDEAIMEEKARWDAHQGDMKGGW